MPSYTSKYAQKQMQKAVGGKAKKAASGGRIGKRVKVKSRATEKDPVKEGGQLKTVTVYPKSKSKTMKSRKAKRK